MIIARSPLRISLGGGGTDLPSYYREFGGFLIAAAIDKAVYVYGPPHLPRRNWSSAIRRSSACQSRARSSTRSSARRCGCSASSERNIEITSMADIPAGTGLGSSGSFGDRPAQGTVPLPQQGRHARAAGRGGLPHRDRRAQRAGRQAGPVRGGLRRHQLLRVPARRQCRRHAAEPVR